MSKLFPAASVAAVANQTELDRHAFAIVAYVMGAPRMTVQEFSEAFDACSARLKEQHPDIAAGAGAVVVKSLRDLDNEAGQQRLQRMAAYGR